MFGKNLEILLMKWGMKQKGFSNLFENMNHHKISSYVRGVSEPSIQFMITLEDITGISIRRLFLEELNISDFPKAPLIGKKPDRQLESVTESSSRYLEHRVADLEREVAEIKKKI